MNITVWNVKRLNDLLKQRGIVGRIKYIKANIVCLLETRVKENKCQQIIDKYFGSRRCYQNYDYVVNGRIKFLWNGSWKVDLMGFMDQCITCPFTTNSYDFVLSAVYGLNKRVDRRRLWSHLLILKGDNTMP